MLLTLLAHSGGGFDRPPGIDLANVIYLVYQWMNTNEIFFYFNGVYIHYTYWSIFINSILFWLLCDILYFGFTYIWGTEVK